MGDEYWLRKSEIEEEKMRTEGLNPVNPRIQVERR
jgi:hypothetical protein